MSEVIDRLKFLYDRAQDGLDRAKTNRELKHYEKQKRYIRREYDKVVKHNVQLLIQ